MALLVIIAVTVLLIVVIVMKGLSKPESLNDLAIKPELQPQGLNLGAQVGGVAVAPLPSPQGEQSKDTGERILARREAILRGMLFEPRDKYSIPLDEGMTFSAGFSDEEFSEIFADTYAKEVSEDFFYCKLAGVSHLNDDGSRRDVAVALCQELELLALVHNAHCEFSRTAVEVRRKSDGLQLGYLPDRIGSEIVGAIKSGASVAAVFRRPNFSPQKRVVVGAVVVVIRRYADA